MNGQLVSDAYVNDPYGSDVGYTGDEIKRIELRKKLETFSGHGFYILQ